MGQDPESIARNKEFFSENERYAKRVAELDTYRAICGVIEDEIAGIHRLLDVGNGGVFVYDTQLVDEVVGVDLFLGDGPSPDLPENATVRRGDALALDEQGGSYDGVLAALLFHHLVGSSADELSANVRRALAEAERVLEPGGKLVVIESCVPEWFYALERRLFSMLALLSRSGVMRHPPTLQLSYERLRSLVAERFELAGGGRIPVGRWILQFGRRWPTALTPARPYAVVARRRS